MDFPFIPDPRSDSEDPPRRLRRARKASQKRVAAPTKPAPMLQWTPARKDPGSRAKRIALSLTAAVEVLRASPSERLRDLMRKDLDELAELCGVKPTPTVPRPQGRARKEALKAFRVAATAVPKAGAVDAAFAVWGVTGVEATLALARWRRLIDVAKENDPKGALCKGSPPGSSGTQKGAREE